MPILKPGPLRGLAFALWVGAIAPACTSTGDGAPANPVRSIAETTGFATTPPAPADFVRSSRPDQADYVPVGVTPPARSLAPRSPDQIKALEAELDSTLNSHSSISGKPRPKAEYRSAATPPEPPQRGDPTGGGRFLPPELPATTTPAPASGTRQRTGP